MNSLFDPFDQIALPGEPMQLPDAEADERGKAGQRGNEDRSEFEQRPDGARQSG